MAMARWGRWMQSHVPLRLQWLPLSLLLQLCLLVSGAAAASDFAPAADAPSSSAWLLGSAPWSSSLRTAPPHPHPPASAVAALTPAQLLALVAPRFPTPPLAPWLVCLLSALFFTLLYLCSYALHEYLADDLEHALHMHAAEERMRRREGGGNGLVRSRRNSNGRDAASVQPSLPPCTSPNGLHHRRVAPMPVQVIPAAVLAPAAAPRSLRSAYLYAYASSGQRSLTAKIDWNSRLVSNVHALGSVLLGLVCMLHTESRVDSAVLDDLQQTDRPLPSESPDGESHGGPSLLHPWSRWFTPSIMAFNEDFVRDASLMVTCGYLAYDLALCLWVRFIKFRGVRDPFWTPPTPPLPRAGSSQQDGTTTSSGQTAPPPPPQQHSSRPSHPPPVHLADGLTLTHHVLIIFAFGLGVHVHVGTVFMSMFLINEASTPALNLNWFLASARAAGMWGADGPDDEQQQQQQRTTAVTAGASLRPVLDVARVYQANGILLFVIFLLLRVLFNVLVLCTMVRTWASLPALWLGADAPFVMAEPASLPPALFAQCALLTALAAGHVAINLAWFGALAKAVRRKIGAGRGGSGGGSSGATPAGAKDTHAE